MKIIFFGSSQFAVPSLDALIKAGHDVACVVTQPDRKRGRHLHVEGTPVKVHARGSGLPVFQHADINASGPVEELKRIASDLFVVVAYGQILSRDLLAVPRLMAVNAHASLLPAYRGAAPINWALIHGEETTGVSIIKMTEKMDAGPVILQQAAAISAADTAVTLERSLAALSGELLVKTAAMFKDGTPQMQPQDERRATYAPKMNKLTGLIRWEKPAALIRNVVRGCLEWPGAYTHYRGRILKIHAAAVCPPPVSTPGGACGEVVAVTADHLYVACGEGTLRLDEVLLEGGTCMGTHEFIAGHKIKAGEKFC